MTRNNPKFFLDDPDAQFKSATRTSKDCSLTEAQVRSIFIPFINTILPDAITRQSNIRSATDIGNIDLNRLQLAIASNGWLVDAVVEIGTANARGMDSAGNGAANTGRPGSGGELAPLQVPSGAFAFLEEARDKPKLVLLDKDSERWRDVDRYARLADATFAFPYADKDRTPVVHFASQSGSSSLDRQCFTIYKRDSRRVYLVEGSISSAASVLRLSAVRGRESVGQDVENIDLAISR